MRVLFISDLVFTRHEQEMIARLAIGLADEGTSVAWAVPSQLAARMSDTLLVPVIQHRAPRLGISTKQRAADLLEDVTRTLGQPPDIVHVFGGGVSRLAAETARAAGATPAFELWRPNLESSVRLLANRAIAGWPNDQSRATRVPLIITPNEPVTQRAHQHFPDAIVRKIPWGVHALRDRQSSSGGAICMLLIGPGRDARSWQAAFAAAVRVLKSNERFHLFADARVTHRLRCWRRAREAGVLDRLSLIDDAETRRDLVLRADILLYSDARGETRSLLLDAMASRVAIIAAADPTAEDLIDGTTARLVADTTEQQWGEAIEHLVNDYQARRALVQSAGEYVQQNHRATRQIVSLIDAYEWVAGDPVRIGPDTGTDVLGHGGG